MGSKMGYKVSATFEFTLDDWESYRERVMVSIKTERMALMSNGKTLIWVDEQIAKLKPKKEKV